MCVIEVYGSLLSWHVGKGAGFNCPELLLVADQQSESVNEGVKKINLGTLERCRSGDPQQLNDLTNSYTGF